VGGRKRIENMQRLSKTKRTFGRCLRRKKLKGKNKAEKPKHRVGNAKYAFVR